MNRKPAKNSPPAAAPAAKPAAKLSILVELMRRPSGATLEDMIAATGWQAHSIRGAISGSIKKAMGLTVVSEKVEGLRRYSIAGKEA